tara:strand:+ start:259 stop:717 length:459 start_codon:yes stop_codon:yes gene_type:complete
MASTVTSATLKVQIQEDIELNGTTRGSKIIHQFSEIAQIDERIMTIPTHDVDVLLLSSSAGAGTYETSTFKYARFTNLDDENFLTITATAGASDSVAVQKLPPKSSMIITSPAISGSAGGVEVGGNTFSNFTAVKASANSSSVDMSLFIATT